VAAASGAAAVKVVVLDACCRGQGRTAAAAVAAAALAHFLDRTAGAVVGVVWGWLLPGMPLKRGLVALPAQHTVAAAAAAAAEAAGLQPASQSLGEVAELLSRPCCRPETEQPLVAVWVPPGIQIAGLVPCLPQLGPAAVLAGVVAGGSAGGAVLASVLSVVSAPVCGVR